MPILSLFPLRWDWFPFAKSKDTSPVHAMPPISDKIARDIGMDPSDLADLRHEWPSDSTDRCRF